jgi:hypothetical protein
MLERRPRGAAVRLGGSFAEAILHKRTHRETSSRGVPSFAKKRKNKPIAGSVSRCEMTKQSQIVLGNTKVFEMRCA